MRRPQEDRAGGTYRVHRRVVEDGKVIYLPGQRITLEAALAAGLIDAEGRPIGDPDGPRTYDPPPLPASGADFGDSLPLGVQPLPASGAGW